MTSKRWILVWKHLSNGSRSCAQLARHLFTHPLTSISFSTPSECCSNSPTFTLATSAYGCSTPSCPIFLVVFWRTGRRCENCDRGRVLARAKILLLVLPLVTPLPSPVSTRASLPHSLLAVGTVLPVSLSALARAYASLAPRKSWTKPC